MRKSNMRGKRRKSNNIPSDGELENGGSGSNAGNSVDATEGDNRMSQTKRKPSRGRNGKNGESIKNDTSENSDEVKYERENENGDAERKGGRKRRKRDEQAARTSQDHTDNNDDDEEYEVEKIVDHRTVKGCRQFLVRWKGYSEESDTWEQEKDLNCAQLIKKYLTEEDKRSKTEKKGRKTKKPANGRSSQPIL